MSLHKRFSLTLKLKKKSFLGFLNNSQQKKKVWYQKLKETEVK